MRVFTQHVAVRLINCLSTLQRGSVS